MKMIGRFFLGTGVAFLGVYVGVRLCLKVINTMMDRQESDDWDDCDDEEWGDVDFCDSCNSDDADLGFSDVQSGCVDLGWGRIAEDEEKGKDKAGERKNQKGNGYPRPDAHGCDCSRRMGDCYDHQQVFLKKENAPGGRNSVENIRGTVAGIQEAAA